MVSNVDINFKGIAPRCGGQREAFEELCCQIARFTIQEKDKNSFVRLRGDGGVECYVDISDNERIGWQAKYVIK